MPADKTPIQFHQDRGFNHVLSWSIIGVLVNTIVMRLVRFPQSMNTDNSGDAQFAWRDEGGEEFTHE